MRLFLLCGFDLLSQAEHGTDSQVILVSKIVD
jgi:histidinol dehydrogenase